MGTYAGKGVDTNRHTPFTVQLDDIAVRQMKKVKQFYGFKTNTELIHSLIRQASMNVDLKS